MSLLGTSFARGADGHRAARCAVVARSTALAVPHRPGLRDAMTEQGGTARTSPYTRPTMETGIRGDRRADVDALYTEAQQALTQSANRLRALTERCARCTPPSSQEARRPPDHRRDQRADDRGRDQQAMDTARAGQLLSRLELITRDLEDGWRFLERGQDGEWSAQRRGAADQLQIERPANLVEAAWCWRRRSRSGPASRRSSTTAPPRRSPTPCSGCASWSARCAPIRRCADVGAGRAGHGPGARDRAAAGLHPAAAAVAPGIGRPGLGAHGRREPAARRDGHRRRRRPRRRPRRSWTCRRARPCCGSPWRRSGTCASTRARRGSGSTTRLEDHAGATRPRLVGPGGPG